MSSTAQIFDICSNAPYVGMSIEVRDTILRQQRPQRHIRTRRNSSTFVKVINLNLKVQLKCRHYIVCEDVQDNRRSRPTLIDEHTSSQHPLANYKLPISTFKQGNKTLKRFLFHQFQTYHDFLDVQRLADKIIQHWVTKIEKEVNEEEEDENNFNVFKRIEALEITLEFVIYRRFATIESLSMMIPTNEGAIESMLKRVEIEETMKLGDESGINCAICLEEISRDEEDRLKSETLVLQMPCLHVFHGECINKWLKTSHYCPTCRFSMPTNN